MVLRSCRLQCRSPVNAVDDPSLCVALKSDGQVLARFFLYDVMQHMNDQEDVHLKMPSGTRHRRGFRGLRIVC
jgi:hypothetical protein